MHEQVMIIRHAQPVHVTQYDPNGNGSDKDAGQQRTVTDGNTLHVTEYCWESGADSMEASGLRVEGFGITPEILNVRLIGLEP